MKKLFRALLPPLLMGLLFAASALMPTKTEMLESALSPELPLEYALPGWYGQRTQESAQERAILAADTRFSKGIYIKRRDDPSAPRNPALTVSLIFSGADMNHSIHRPERCLPAQGHLSLNARTESIALADGRELEFTRLASLTQVEGKPLEYTHHIHYYVFVGHSSILSSHLPRVFRDIYDRCVSGQVQRWAYCQVGVQWGGETGFSEEEADAQLRELIAQLLPQLIDWETVGG